MLKVNFIYETARSFFRQLYLFFSLQGLWPLYSLLFFFFLEHLTTHGSNFFSITTAITLAGVFEACCGASFTAVGSISQSLITRSKAVKSGLQRPTTIRAAQHLASLICPHSCMHLNQWLNYHADIMLWYNQADQLPKERRKTRRWYQPLLWQQIGQVF